MNYKKIKSKVQAYHRAGKTVEAAKWVLQIYDLQDHHLKGFELREKAEPNYILLTTEGNFGVRQIVRIPENIFAYSLPLILTLLAHEMVHVRQKTRLPYVLDKNEREWQAYFEMNFHTLFPQLPEVSTFHKIFFAKKGLEYYNRMGEGSALQQKYADQKKQVEALIDRLSLPKTENK